MNDILKVVADNWQAISAAAGAVVAVVGSISAQVSKNKIKRLIDKSRQDGHYLVCPHCKRTIDINKEVHFYLPDGSVDDDLDGEKDPD